MQVFDRNPQKFGRSRGGFFLGPIHLQTTYHTFWNLTYKIHFMFSSSVFLSGFLTNHTFWNLTFTK